MTRLTAMEIASNYPDNISIMANEDPKSKKWTSALYLKRDGFIHKIMLSFPDFPYDSRDDAISGMEELVKIAINFVDQN